MLAYLILAAIGIGYAYKKGKEKVRLELLNKPEYKALPSSSKDKIDEKLTSAQIAELKKDISFLSDITFADRVEGFDDPEKLGASIRARGYVKPSDCDSPSNPSPNPNGGDPVDGVASNLMHQWCMIVQEGDTPGKIADAYTGDRSRYLELLAANISKDLIAMPELNFKELKVGEKLYIPKCWNPWIDQKGNAYREKGIFYPYKNLPPYPKLFPNTLTAGYIPWPPENPSTWVEIPFKNREKNK